MRHRTTLSALRDVLLALALLLVFCGLLIYVAPDIELHQPAYGEAQ